MIPSEAQLDALRLVGDPSVDPIVELHCAKNLKDSGRLLGDLFQSPRLQEDHPLVSAYLAAIATEDPVLPVDVEQGQRLFQLFAPEILLILGSYALPLAYAAGHGVQVIARARRLKEEPVRRLCDTAQMVINAMEPGGLASGGVGWRSTRKVRLIHALIRHHVRNMREPWSDVWGTPINQEDQAGTLLTFSAAVLDGLRRMGAHIAPADADAFIHAWNAVGRLLGVDESLLPKRESDAVALAERIGGRQVCATPEGKLLMHELLLAVDSLFPVRGYALGLSHFFLESTVFGANVATLLELPPPNWTRWLIRARAAQKRVVLDWLEKVPGAKRRRSYIARRFAQGMIALRRPDSRVPFEIPPGLARTLGVPSSALSAV